MTNLMTNHQHPHHTHDGLDPGITTSDIAFYELVGRLHPAVGPDRPARIHPDDAWHRRGLAWLRLADRLRALGHRVEIGASS